MTRFTFSNVNTFKKNIHKTSAKVHKKIHNLNTASGKIQHAEDFLKFFENKNSKFKKCIHAFVYFTVLFRNMCHTIVHCNINDLKIT